MLSIRIQIGQRILHALGEKKIIQLLTVVMQVMQVMQVQVMRIQIGQRILHTLGEKKMIQLVRCRLPSWDRFQEYQAGRPMGGIPFLKFIFELSAEC